MTAALHTADLHRVAQEMIDVLTLENQSLMALDFPAAARLLGRKNAAAAALQRQGVAIGPGSRQVARTLLDTAEANRTLLERAIAVQGRVIAAVAQAARVSALPARYGAGGGMATDRTRHAFAVNARA